MSQLARSAERSRSRWAASGAKPRRAARDLLQLFAKDATLLPPRDPFAEPRAREPMQPDPKTRRAPLRLETLGAALEQKLQNEAEILDVLVAAAQRGQDQPELWARLDAAAARDDRLAELAFAYERLSRDKKLAKLPPAVQADILARIGAYFVDTFGDPDGAEVYLQQAVGLAPAHSAAFAKLEALLIRKQEGLRLSDLY